MILACELGRGKSVARPEGDATDPRAEICLNFSVVYLFVESVC